MNIGQTVQFQAQGSFSKSGRVNTTQDVTSQVTWQSASPSIATISAAGVATGVSAGTASISASLQGTFGLVTATTNITVNATAASRILTALTVSPGSQTITATGQTAQFIALGTYSAAPLTADLTNSTKWESSNVQVATVNASGLVSGVGAGQATITALATAADGSVISANGSVSVTTAPSGRILTALTVSPGSQTITATGQTAQFIALGTYSAAPLSTDLTNSSKWESSNVQVATVSFSGLVSGVGVGQATITALATASDGSVISANGSVTVTTSPSGRILTSLTVVPSSQVVNAAGETAQYIAIGTYSATPLTVDLTGQVSWRSSDVLVAQVDSSGLVTENSTGSTTITALALASDGSVIPATASFQGSGTGSVQVPTLTVYKVGNGTGTVTAGTSMAGGVISGTVVINCGTGTGCIGNFPKGTQVFFVATPVAGSKFDGWSVNCTVNPNNANSCSIVMTNNATVGAIFDPTTP